MVLVVLATLYYYVQYAGTAFTLVTIQSNPIPVRDHPRIISAFASASLAQITQSATTAVADHKRLELT
jgi:hypothetical protein